MAANLATPGTLVRARGREWLVLPESSADLLIVRPIGGLDQETTGIIPGIEPVESATFSLPSRKDLGDFTSGRLLQDAARLSTRSAAGPFRSFGRIGVEPRPYQLVPLIMALRLDPVRLLIADDVGIGKTVEACLIARELLDRSDIRRFTVLCPPHLAEQWQGELKQKFHIEAELVLSSTIRRLTRDLPLDVSVFDRYPFTVVSTDFIKSAHWVDHFVLKCPEFVIVDEAHGCTLTGGAAKGRQLRHSLVQRISQNRQRHLLLVTATPHSGNEEAFRSLLGLLDPEFGDLPNELKAKHREGIRHKLSQHLVQRRRQDIVHYLHTDTNFPRRVDADPEPTYTFGARYQALFDDILAFALEYVAAEEGGYRRRVRYWSALGLLRCISSSPRAAAATLRSRARVDEVEPDEIDEIGRQTVLDHDAVDEVTVVDFSPGSETRDAGEPMRRTLLEFARRAEALTPADDRKLQGAVKEIKKLIEAGFRPIVFCRFIETSDYVAQQLRVMLGASVRVESVTSVLPDTEREKRIHRLAEGGVGKYVLVCTDCLSEGINLQHDFDAVLHYDLAWNPTRHEQREGRVDRFGQANKEIRVVTYYGTNPVDGVILDVLIRKHKVIRNDLGVTVAVPGTSEQVAEALFQGALLRESSRPVAVSQLTFDFFDDLGPRKQALHAQWDEATVREEASRSRYAQQTLNPEFVAAELLSVREAIGSDADAQRFLETTLALAGVPIEVRKGSLHVNVQVDVARSLRQALGHDEPFTGRAAVPVGEGEIYLGRTSSVVEGLAGWVLDQALDAQGRDSGLGSGSVERPVAARCGVISSSSVALRTVLLLVRFRHHLQVGVETLLCEEIVPLGCTGNAAAPTWLAEEASERLFAVRPERDLKPTALDQQINWLESSLAQWRVALEPIATRRAELQLQAHQRARQMTQARGRVTVRPVLPVDILGAYILLPVPD